MRQHDDIGAAIQVQHIETDDYTWHELMAQLAANDDPTGETDGKHGTVELSWLKAKCNVYQPSSRMDFL